MINTRLTLLIGSCLMALGMTAVASAQEEDPISEMARAHTYPGGKDEDPLQVQETLPTPVRKVTTRAIENRQIRTKLKKKAAANNQGN